MKIKREERQIDLNRPAPASEPEKAGAVRLRLANGDDLMKLESIRRAKLGGGGQDG
jgi:hypothetical protein